MSLYLRVMILALAYVVVLVALGSWMIYSNWLHLYSWPGWKEMHSHWFDIQVVSNSIWQTDERQHTSIEMSRWQFVFNGFVIFAIFVVHKQLWGKILSAMRCIFFQCVPRMKGCFVFASYSCVRMN
jgi:pheromone a factor receptor